MLDSIWIAYSQHLTERVERCGLSRKMYSGEIATPKAVREGLVVCTTEGSPPLGVVSGLSTQVYFANMENYEVNIALA